MANLMINTVETKMYAQRGGRLRINYLHWHYNNPPPTAAELANLNADIELNIIDKYEDFVSLGTQWYQIISTDIGTSSGETSTRTVNRISLGPIDDLPGNCSYVLTKRTATRGRSFRGRLFLIDLPEDFFNGDLFNTFYGSPISNLMAAIVTPRQAGRFNPAVGSKTLGISTPFTAMTHDGVADSQRKRLTGRGA